MSSDLDKFVLQYSVDLKDSIKKLEELQKRMSGVSAAHKESAGQLKEFVTGASGELGKLVPELNAVGSAARMMGAGFSVAAVAVGALAIGVKAVLALKDQYGAQRLLGQDIGVSGLRIEEYNRKFIKHGVPTMDRAQAEAGLKVFADKSKAAFMAPGGVEWQQMQRLGVDPGRLGSPGKGTNAELAAVAEKLQKMSDDQIQGLAAATGINRDWLVSLKQIGPEIAKITEHTQKEIDQRKTSQRDIDKLNADMGRFNDEVLRLQQQIGILVAGPMAKFVGYIADIVHSVNNMPKEEADDLHDFLWGSKKGESTGEIAARMAKRAYNKAKYGRPEGAEPEGSWETDPDAPAPGETKKSKDEEVAEEDEQHRRARQVEEDMAAAIKAFGASVTTFSAAVSTAQAWAAWAGNVGAAGGLTPNSSNGGMGEPTPSGQGGGAVTFPVTGPGARGTGNTDYDEIIKDAAAKYHVDPNLIKRVISAESKFDPNATSGAGARGLMQIMPSNYKALGLDKDTVTDPRKNIMGGTRLLAENLAHFKNEGDALRAYNGGWDPKKWGNKETSEYVGRVNSQNVSISAPGTAPYNPRAGQGKKDLQLAGVQSTIANFLGVDLKSIQQGGENRGDVAFAAENIQRGLGNSISALKREGQKFHTPEEHSKILNDIRDQERGLALMKQYSPSVIASAQEGGQEKTIGQIVFNVTMSTNDPEAMTQELNDHFVKKMTDAINQISTGQKI
jgi:Transglycosylase SLT domain